ncbi:MAG: YihY/virulence factor BrkB family protein [candidate division Zixibacteria bacterium]|nr:YihY/virulence factor BrkB family protein [candidate division Zixibacteria bacterium]
MAGVGKKILRYLRVAGRFLGYYVGGIYSRVGDHHVFLLGSGLAFSLIVCIIPMVLIIFSALGMVLDRPAIRDEIALFIDRAVPYADYAVTLKQLVFSRVDEFVIYKSLAGIIGVIGLLVASTSLFSSMRTVLSTVYRSEVGESILVGKLRDLGLVVLVLVYFLAAITILPILNIVERFAGSIEVVDSITGIGTEVLASQGVSFVLILLSFFIIYFAVPHKRPPRKAIVVSALSAAILWHLAERLFGFYVTNFVTFRRIYGAYALVLASAFWIYYTSIVFIIGAEIGQLYRERSET